MIGRRFARVIPRLLNIIVLVVSGAYLLVYLYRWEWNRAVISGVFFIAAEIALSTTLILEQLRGRSDTPHAIAARTISAANARRTRAPFGWLTKNDRLGVFIPVLLGAGVLLSALGYIVERIAGAFAGPAVDRRTVRLVDLDLPIGTRALRPAAPRGNVRSTSARALGWMVATAALVLFVITGINVLAEATQSRLARTEATTGITVVTLTVDQKNLSRPEVDLAEALWVTCRSVAPPGAQLEQIRALGANRVQLVLTPAMGELRRRRVFGCLEDAMIDRVSVNVIDWSSG